MPWGAKDFSGNPAPPLLKAPKTIAEPNELYKWKLIPKITKAFAEAFAELGARIVDLGSVLALRPDCREDYIHHWLPVFEQSFVPMLQHAIQKRKGKGGQVEKSGRLRKTKTKKRRAAY